MKFYSESKEDVLKELSVNRDRGLSSDDVKSRRDKYGLNEFTPMEEGSFWDDLKDALSEPMIVILIIAAIISAVIGEFHDAIGIVCAIAIGIAIGMITEGRSKKAAEALSKLTENIDVKVLRDGEVELVSKSDLVPGDIVFIETGDMIPADGRLIKSINLKVREDMLTGESDDVSKKCDAIIGMEKVETKDGIKELEPIPAKQINMVFGGTLVAYGTGMMVVTSIGDNTQMGDIARHLSGDEEDTPLQIKLGNLGGMIAKISSAIAGLLFIFMVVKMVLNGLKVDTSNVFAFLDSIDEVKTAFTVCVALIVAAVPEGLPTMINMTLAITMQKMAKINALVTKKEACETIGSVSVICSDKTGTLTQNRMTVEVAYIDGRYVEDKIESNSYFLENCTINSTADIEINEDETKYLGSATECALLLRNKDVDYRKMRNEAIIIAQNQFSSNLKRMSTIITENNKYVLLTKGAPEIVLELCKYVQEPDGIKELTKERKEKILSEIAKLQEKSMRALGFAYKEMSLYDESQEAAVALEEEEEISIEKCEESLVFGGFVGIRDPLRPDVKHAVDTAHHAGVSVKMLTGDNINTARAIGEDLGLLKNNMRAVEASYIDTLTDEELREEIKTISIVARSKPDSKMRIVQALQADGEVVAVTGDGINDAPALSKADVGIAMGISGTEVSKNAADIILTDDSFSTIVSGIKWGRGIYDNFQRFVQFQLTVNIIAFLVAIISQVVGQEMPFTTIQLLWVNIIMDGPPALALGLEPVRKHVLDRKPVNRNASIITKSMIFTIIGNALYITLILMLQSSINILNIPEAKGETVMFGIFAFSALFNAFNCREFNFDSIIPNLTKNKLALQIIGITAVAQIFFTQVFRDFFNAVPLSVMEWIKIIALSFTVIIVDEVVKFVFRLLKKENKNDENMPKVEA